MISTVTGSLFRNIFYMIDSLIYSLVPSMYSIIYKVVNIGSLIDKEQEIIAMVASSIYTLLAVIMLFRLAFSFLTMIADPDKIEDKEKGLSKIVTSVIGCVVLIIVVPMIFEVAGDIQQKVLDEKIIESVVLGENFSYCKEEEDFDLYNSNDCKPENTGTYLSYSMLNIMLNINESEKITEKIQDPPTYYAIKSRYEEIVMKPKNQDFKERFEELFSFIDYINETNKNDYGKRYIINYTIIVSTIVGGYLLWIMATFVIDVAYRAIKLFLLELISPIAIISFVDPSSASKGIFKKWTEECIKTYLSIFLRIASLAFVSLILYSINFTSMDLLVKVFFFLALLTLLKTLPKLLETLFGIKPKSKEESFGQSLLRGALGAATVGTYGGLKGGIDAKKNGGSFWGGLAVGAKTGLFGGATSAYNGKTGDYFKAFGNSSAAVAKTYGFKTGAELRKDKMKYNSDKNYSKKVFDKFGEAYSGDLNNIDATKMINEYSGGVFGVSFSKNEQGQIRKAYAEKNAFSKILSTRAANNRGNLAVKKTESRLLKNELDKTVRSISITSNETEKAALHTKASALQERINLREKQIGDLETEWKEVIVRDPSNYKDVQTYGALEMAKADSSNKLRNEEIDTLLNDKSDTTVMPIASGSTPTSSVRETRSTTPETSSIETEFIDDDGFEHYDTIDSLRDRKIDDDGFEHYDTLFDNDINEKNINFENKKDKLQSDYEEYMRSRDPDGVDIETKKQTDKQSDYEEYMRSRDSEDI